MKRLTILVVMVSLLLCGLVFAIPNCNNWLKCKPDLEIEFREYRFIFNDRESFKCYMKDVALFKHKLLIEYGYDIPFRE